MAQSLREYEENLRRIADITSEGLEEQIIVPSASRLLGNIKNRIQRDGKNSDGQDIGEYSEKSMYAEKKDFKKTGAFKAVGKNGFKGEKVVTTGKGKKKQFKVVKSTPQSMYLAHGYKQLRDIQGMPTDKMNFTYRGDLLLDYKMVAENGKVLLGIASAKQAQKRKNLEAKKGRVFPAQTSELDEYKQEVTEAFTEVQVKLLRGY